MRLLTDSERVAIFDVAKELGVEPKTLAALIAFETAGTMNPQIKNPGSSARGLIQFMDSTARSMRGKDNFHFVGSWDLVRQYPTFEEQLRGPVVQYLKKFAPFEDDQALFMAVFFPAYMYAEPDRVFPQWVQDANPGIVKVSDYVQHVWDKVGDVDLGVDA